MKKVIKTTAWVLAFAVCIWIGASFIDIVADNKSENPQHSDLNFFVLITEDEETNENIYAVNAKVFEINTLENVVAFLDGNDHIWVAEVEDASEFEIGAIHTITFTDCGTGDDWYDDEIIDITEAI